MMAVTFCQALSATTCRRTGGQKKATWLVVEVVMGSLLLPSQVTSMYLFYLIWNVIGVAGAIRLLVFILVFFVGKFSWSGYICLFIDSDHTRRTAWITGWPLTWKTWKGHWIKIWSGEVRENDKSLGKVEEICVFFYYLRDCNYRYLIVTMWHCNWCFMFLVTFSSVMWLKINIVFEISYFLFLFKFSSF